MTDQTAAIEVWARMLCAADVHVHGEDHPTWQQLAGEPGRRIRDDYRKAAAWLLPRMTVATAPATTLPAFARAAAVAEAVGDRLRHTQPERAQGAYEVMAALRCLARGGEAAEPANDRAELREQIADARQRLFGVRWADAEKFGAALDEYTAAVLPATTDRAAEELAAARATNQRLNYEKQRLESELAAYRRAVAQWEISDTGTYVPLRTLAVIAKAAGLNVPERWELHYERVERAEAELRRVAAEAGPAETAGQDVSEKRVVAYRSPGSRTLYCITCARQETGWQPLTEVLDDAVCDFCGGRILAIASRTLGAVIARHVEEPPAAAQQSKEA